MTILGGFDPYVFQPNVFQNTTLPAAHYGSSIIYAMSQTGIQGARSVFIAGSACVVNASWFDINGNPFAPNSVSYSIVDTVSGVEIASNISITPYEVNQVTISGEQNIMISQSRNYELHQVIFEIVDGFGDVEYAQVSFDIVVAPPNPLAECACAKT